MPEKPAEYRVVGKNHEGQEIDIWVSKARLKEIIDGFKPLSEYPDGTKYFGMAYNKSSKAITVNEGDVVFRTIAKNNKGVYFVIGSNRYFIED